MEIMNGWQFKDHIWVVELEECDFYGSTFW